MGESDLSLKNSTYQTTWEDKYNSDEAYKAYELHMLGESGMWEEFVQNYPELAKAIERDNRDE